MKSVKEVAETIVGGERKREWDLQEICGECCKVVMRKTGCAYVHSVQPFNIYTLTVQQQV